MPRWRYWLIDLPAQITDASLVWYRALFMALLWVAALAAIVGLIGLMASLVLQFVFGIRWGW